MKIDYRPDIDGLRAIAVISVIFYHADQTINNLRILPGGFAGVDIFFVISGFLITSIILNELNETDSFSFFNFYERRCRRIIPVLLFVFIVSFPFIWLYFIPSSFIDFSKSLLSSLLFFSNYFFYFSGELYDAENSLLKPLMHTWSLSIEEQFYIVFPLMFYVSFKFLKIHLLKVFSFFLLVSFLLMIITFNKNESLAFFGFFSRFWELMFGCLIGILSFKKKKTNKTLSNIYSFFGLILIVYSIFFFDHRTSYPFFQTLTPVCGAGLVIYYNNKNSFFYKILSLKPIVFIGLISYSLYLWHYPIFAIGRTTEFFGDGISKKLFLLTFLFSLITYYFIEKPVKKKKLSKKNIFIAIAFIYSVLLFLSQISIDGKIKAVRGDIFKNLSVGNETKNLTVCKDDYLNEDGYCVFNSKKEKTLILVGDSHMQTLEKPLLEYANQNKFKLVIINRSACFYFLDLDLIIKNQLSACTSEYQKKRRKIILSQKNAIIILGGRTPHYLSGYDFDNEEGGGKHIKIKGLYYKSHNEKLGAQSDDKDKLIKHSFNKTITDLLSNNLKVILVYPIPEVGWNVSKKLIIKLGLNLNSLENLYKSKPLTTSHQVFYKRSKNIYSIYDDIKDSNLFRVYPENLFCNTLISKRCITHNDKKVFYIDDDHLSYDGASLIVDSINKIIQSTE